MEFKVVSTESTKAREDFALVDIPSGLAERMAERVSSIMKLETLKCIEGNDGKAVVDGDHREEE